MADIRTVPGFDLTTAVNPEYPMRVGGKWGPVDTTWDESVKFDNTTFGAHHSTDKGNGIWWSLNTEAVYFGDVEAWGVIIGGQLGVAGEGWRIGLWDALSLSGGGTARGYVGMVFHALGDLSAIRKYTDAGTFTYIASGGGAPPWNQYLLFRRRGDTLELWDGNAAATTWNLRLSVVDATFSSAPIMIGFGSEDPTHGGLGWQYPGGGQRTRTRIIRYVSN